MEINQASDVQHFDMRVENKNIFLPKEKKKHLEINKQNDSSIKSKWGNVSALLKWFHV